MADRMISVGVNGYGVIGKRVADALRVQPDMRLVGIGDAMSDYRIKAAVARGIPVYASVGGKAREMEAAGVPIAGTLDDLLAAVDVMVDCTPKGIGARNLEHYRQARVKAVYQGGEQHGLTGHSFVDQANYQSALNDAA